jgi:hypothetical protein
MIAHTNWVRAILAALAVGVLFVLTVRAVGLNELAQRDHCNAGQLETCRGGESSGPSD